MPIKRGFRMLRVLDTQNGVHQCPEVAEVDAANRTIELVVRIRFAALQDTDAGQTPVIDNIGSQRVSSGKVGHRSLEVDAEDVGAVKVRRGP